MMFSRAKNRRLFIFVPIFVGGCLLVYTVHMLYSQDIDVRPAHGTATRTSKDRGTSIQHRETVVAALKSNPSRIRQIKNYSSFGSEFGNQDLNGRFIPQQYRKVLPKGDNSIWMDNSLNTGKRHHTAKENTPINVDNIEHRDTSERTISDEYIPVSLESQNQPKRNNDSNSGYKSSRPENVNISAAQAIEMSTTHAGPPCPFPELKQFPEPLYNFKTFPCLSGLTPSEQLGKNGKCVRTVNFPDTMLKNKTGCTMLRLGHGTPICTYPSETDKYVSKWLNNGDVWEGGLVGKMLSVLQNDPDIVLLDAGCNVGVYTLAAASLSHKVISVDANFENLYLVSRSVTLGNIWKHVTLIWNAFSLRHEQVILRKEVYPKNIGGAEIDPNNNTMVGCDIAVNSIVLDDLKDLLVNKTVFIKIDIQGQEHNFFEHGNEFFKMTDVRYVQLEYVMHRGIPSGRVIIDNMIGYGFLPYTDCLGKQLLKPAEEADWPYDICFIQSNRFK